MLIFSGIRLALRAGAAVLLLAVPAFAQNDIAALPAPSPGSAATAADAVNEMAGMFGGADGGVSESDMLAALEGAAAAGQPLALYRLGMMYENGTGVERDRAKAFGYFARIADQNADTPPRSIEADVVAQSFVKMGEYYREGLPDAGITADEDHSRALLMHAASYFGDADAQYRVGMIFLDEDHDDASPLQGARWLSLAARKGHVAAQAELGDMLFNGEGVPEQPIEGLMWLTLAQQASVGTDDAPWVDELLTRAMSVATPQQRQQATNAADAVRQQIAFN